ncbi:hypothetical protein [Streptococcus porcinus]|uniref:hypothetical protein n=1 Tax=Streptococcus porcinus TaxID=1340 RepID=UPI001E4C371A|nr:hypothetical protein [Streptococcus porcinus]
MLRKERYEKKITDEQLNNYLEVRAELGEENFEYANFVYDYMLTEKKEKLIKDVKMEITDFKKIEKE